MRGRKALLTRAEWHWLRESAIANELAPQRSDTPPSFAWARNPCRWQIKVRVYSTAAHVTCMYLQNACMWRHALVKRSALVPYAPPLCDRSQKRMGRLLHHTRTTTVLRECVGCAIKGDDISAHHARSCAPQNRASDVDIARMAPRRSDAASQRRTVRTYGVCVCAGPAGHVLQKRTSSHRHT